MARSAVEGQGLLIGASLGAEGVRSADAEAFQRLAQVSLQRIGLSQADQTAQRALTVRRRRVAQNSRHRLAGLGVRGVDSFPKARGRVSAFERKLTDQSVGQGMQKHVSQARVAESRLKISLMPPSAVGGDELGLECSASPYPVRYGLLGNLQEKTFSPHLRGRNPVWAGSTKRRQL